MRERKYFCLLIMLLFAIVTLLAPKSATAVVDCTDTSLVPNSYHVLPDGTKVDGTFYVEADAGNPIVSTDGYQFIFEICSLAGESLAQANLLIPSEIFCEISKVGREPRSVKIREFEPSTGFSLTDPNTNVITWDALKLDPSNQEIINVYLTRTGAGPSLMELKTETGQQYVQIDGPICCSTTQIPTALTLTSLAFEGDNSGDPPPEFVITYDACTGEADAPSEEVFEELKNGAFVCDSETELAPGDRCSPWIRIRQLGPRSGAALLTENIETLKKVRLFGFGKKIYKERIAVTRPLNNVPCEEGGEILAREVVTFNNRIRAKYNKCGEPFDIRRCPDGDCAESAVEREVYIAPALQNGRPNTRELLRVLAGPRGGALIDANPSYLCSRFGIGCWR
jgi:hypothetical protein